MIASTLVMLAATIGPFGALPHDLSTGQVFLALRVSGVSPAQVQDGANDPRDPDQQLAARFQVTLPGISAAPLPVEGVSPVRGSEFSLTWYRDHKETVQADGTSTFEYYLQIDEVADGALARRAADHRLEVGAAFFLGGATASHQVASLPAITLAETTPPAGGIPATPGAIPTAGGAQVLWTPDPAAPPSINIYAIDKGLGEGFKLPAHEMSGIAGVSDRPARCDFYNDADTGSCVVCPSDDHGDYYLVPSELAAVPGVAVQSLPTGSGEADFGGLDATKTYLVLAQYAPNGVHVSQCMPATPYLPANQQAEVDARLAAFYAEPLDPSAMFHAPAKFSVASGAQVHTHPELRLPSPPADPLLRLAQAKALPAYKSAVCSPSATRGFKSSPCVSGRQPWTAVESGDEVSALAAGWLPQGRQVTSLDLAPLAGQAEMPPFSDDYWRERYGGLSYRYASGAEFSSYQQAVAAYAQPADWRQLLDAPLSDQALTKTAATWSPAEKYDLTVGDTAAFTLTNAAKAQGQADLVNGDVPDWLGICDGWAASATMTPRVTGPAYAIGPTGLAVVWYPADVRALISLAWARGQFVKNFIGGHCPDETPATFPNGRLVNNDCFKTNPATFHLALINMLGIAHQGFVMDADYDAEIWNQPVVSFKTVYFNPLDHTRRSNNWRDVAVPYDAAFKSKDRFQHPLTRGVRHRGAGAAADTYDDSAITQVVGAMTTVVYDDEYHPTSTANVAQDQLVQASYTYDLELSGDTTPTGGEWQSNAHPNFLWVPAKGAMITLAPDPPDFNPSALPAPALTTAAQASSSQLMPLCSVLTALARQSSGKKDATFCQ